MKLKISIPQIFAKKVTHPRTDADEIYLAYFITLAKPGKDVNTTKIRKYVSKKVSNVKNGVKNCTKWEPKQLETIIETGDADALFFTLGLYECDDGKIYKKLVKESDILVEPENFDWSIIEIPSDPTNWFSWIKPLWKLIFGVYNYFRQDDLLGTECIVIPLIKEAIQGGFGGLREFKFKRYGGDYRVSVNIEVINDD